MSDYKLQMPPLLSGEQVLEALLCLPRYNESIRSADDATRLTALSDIYQIYIPSMMTVEVYAKLYSSMSHSMEKKKAGSAVKQRIYNYKTIQGSLPNGIMGGLDSFTIIGASGIGKSSTIYRCIESLTERRTVVFDDPYTKVLPFLVVQCPHDCSVRGFLLETLRLVDLAMGSSYYQDSLKTYSSIDILIGFVSQVALNHIGILIIDEIQNVCQNKNGTNLVAMFTQLINCSGIGICMVGTPECASFFQDKLQIARRSTGLYYDALPYNDYFRKLCKYLFRYQYTKQYVPVTEGMMQWLYEHSAGLISLVVALYHDAQELAILKNKEKLSIELFQTVYKERMQMIQGHISKPAHKLPILSKTEAAASFPLPVQETTKSKLDVVKILMDAKKVKQDPVKALKDHGIFVEEVPL